VLTALRQPLASGHVAITRSGVITRFPARFTLIAATAPCPCAAGAGCQCTPLQTRRYRARPGSELGSYIAIRIPVSAQVTRCRRRAEPEVWAAQVADSRDRARYRLRGTPWHLNAEIPGSELARSWHPGPEVFAAVARAVDLGQISSRAVMQVARLAWTLADLAGKTRPGTAECAQALAFHLGTAS